MTSSPAPIATSTCTRLASPGSIVADSVIISSLPSTACRPAQPQRPISSLLFVPALKAGYCRKTSSLVEVQFAPHPDRPLDPAEGQGAGDRQDDREAGQWHELGGQHADTRAVQR